MRYFVDGKEISKEEAENMLMAVCGYSIESLIEQIEKLDQSNYVWGIC